MDENPYEAPQATKKFKLEDDFSAEKVRPDAAISVVKWNLVLVVSAFCCKFLQVNSGEFEESLFGHAAAVCTFAFLVVWPISGLFIIATRQPKTAPLPSLTRVIVGALSVFWLMVVVTLVNFLSI